MTARVPRRLTRHLRDFAPAILLIASLLALWEVVSRAVEMPDWLLPAPSDLGASFGEAAPLLGPHVAATVTAAAAGYALALASAVVLAAAIDRWGLARRAIYPLLVTSQTIPTFALAPLLAIWFGFGLLPKVLVVALVCFSRSWWRRSAGCEPPTRRCSIWCAAWAPATVSCSSKCACPPRCRR